MKVLYILNSTMMAGATISFINMITGLKDKGVDIVVLMPNEDETLRNIFKDIASAIYIVPVCESIIPLHTKGSAIKDKLYFVGRLFYLFYKKCVLLFRLLKVIKKVSPDIVHTNTGTIQEGLFASKILGIPHVWHIREYQDKDFDWKIYPTKSLYKFYLRHSTTIFISQLMQDCYGLTKHNYSFVIYNGIYSKNSVFKVSIKKKYFMCASRISREKGFDDTVLAFSRFHQSHPDYRLVILGIGTDEYVNHLKEMAAELGCADSIDWLGFKDDVRPYMSEAKALIVSSLFEGFGRMTAEAAFTGCLVIGRNTGGTKEIMDITGGYRFSNAEELAEKMDEVSRLNELQYNDLARIAQQCALDNFTTESNTVGVYNLYKSL
jgi:glycosyltransferase involved in cell wall biosynthesis